MNEQTKKVPWFLFPFWLLYELTLWIIKLTGRILGVLLGLVFLILGIVLSATIVGALLGVPMIILGVMLMVRSLF